MISLFGKKATFNDVQLVDIPKRYNPLWHTETTTVIPRRKRHPRASMPPRLVRRHKRQKGVVLCGLR